VRIGFGVREPFTNTNRRTPQVLAHLLWDRQMGIMEWLAMRLRGQRGSF